MNARYGALVSGFLFASFVACFGCGSADTASATASVAILSAEQPGCEALATVIGRGGGSGSGGMSDEERADYAMDSLRREAASRGATHVRLLGEPERDPRDPMWVVVYGRAYRCAPGSVSAEAPEPPSSTPPPAAPDGSGTPAEDASPSADDTPETPSRSDVVDGMNRIAPRIRECSTAGGDVHVQVTFDSSGQVTSARVMAPGERGYARSTVSDPGVIACVERVARTARVPPFRRPSFNVAFPYRFSEAL